DTVAGDLVGHLLSDAACIARPRTICGITAGLDTRNAAFGGCCNKVRAAFHIARDMLRCGYKSCIDGVALERNLQVALMDVDRAVGGENLGHTTRLLI